MALYGPWGSGKSSVKNMAVEALKGENEKAPIIIEFNPWQWAGQGQIAEAFFDEIRISLGRPNHEKASKETSRKLRYYAARLKMGGFFAGGLTHALPIFLVLFSSLGLASLIPGKWMRIAQGIIGILALAVFVAFKWSEKFSIILAEFFEAKRETEQKSLTEIKSEIVLLLSKRDKPILIIMDDVDRLFPEDVKLLFQVIKSNADFPNLVYLLLFQRDIIEKSLGELLPKETDGKGFLEKIVQVGFDVPHVDRACLENVLFSGLNKELADESVSKQFSQERFGNIFIPGLRPYFKTPRDVYRFLSSFTFHVGLFKRGATFEVNPVDLIALEVLRVFEPEIYRRLSSLKEDLTQGRGRHETRDEKRKQKVQALVTLTLEDHREQVEEVLKKLFPPAEWIFGGSTYGDGFDKEWLQTLRVCAPEMFDKYFILTTPTGEIAQAEVEDLLAYTDNRPAFLEKIRVIARRGLLGVMLNRLDDAYKETIDLRHANPFISALLDIGDELPEKQVPGLVDIGPDMRICRIILWYLKREKDIEKRGQILVDAVKTSVGLYLPIMKTSLECDRNGHEPDAFVVNERHLGDLKKLCLERIIVADQGGRLRSHPKLAYILHRWKEWASEDEPKKWAAGLIRSQEGSLQLLTAFLHITSSWGLESYVAKTKTIIRLKDLEIFVSIQELEKTVQTIDSSTLPEKEKAVIEAFLKAIRRRQQGKPEGDFIRDDD